MAIIVAIGITGEVAIGIAVGVTIGIAIHLAVGNLAITGTVNIIAVRIVTTGIIAMGIITVVIIAVGIIAMVIIAMRGGARRGLIAFDEPVTDRRARCRAVIGIAAGVLLTTMIA